MKEYRYAHKIFKAALLYVLAVGGAASLFLYFGAGLLVGENVVPVLRTFAPTIFVYGVLGVLRGYFQAHRSMVQTSVSQILEQIVNAVVTVGAAYFLIYSRLGTMDMPVDEAGQVERATNGAIGSALGTGAGVLAALLFMVGIYRVNYRTIRKRIHRDRGGREGSYGEILKMITLVVTPFILSTAVYNLSGTVNNSIYLNLLPSLREVDEVALNARWGIFSAQALTISNIPIAFASAMAAAMIPTVAQLLASRDVPGAREKIGLSVKTTMIISIPCAAGLLVLARPVVGLLFVDTQAEEDLATGLLMALSFSVVFYALSTLNNQILQGLGKVNIPIVNAGIALMAQTVTAVVLLLCTDLDLYSIAVANTVYSGLMCMLNQRAVRRAVGYRQEVWGTFVIPILASALMAGMAWACYEGLLMITSSPKFSVAVAIVVAVIVYFALLLLLRGVTEEELLGFPKGRFLVRMGKKFRLIR